MTTAHVHSLTQSGTARAAKFVFAKPVMAVVKVQRMIMAFSFVGWLIRMHRNYRSRQELASLSPRLLADIGVSEAQRRAELSKPFWKTRTPG